MARTTHYDPNTGWTVVDVQETDEGPRPGTILKPIPESYAGQNFPYRGIETHGVDPLYDVPPPPDSWEGGMVTVDADRLDEEPEKVSAVRIVNTGPKELTEWRSYRVFATAAASILVGRMPNRVSFQLKNLSADRTVYVGGDLTVSAAMGWPIGPGESFSVDADTEVWGLSDNGSDVDMAVYVVFTVEVR